MTTGAVHVTRAHLFDAEPGGTCDGCGKARGEGLGNAYRYNGYAYCRVCWDGIVRQRARTSPALRWKVVARPLVEIVGRHSVIIMPDAADSVIATEKRFGEG